VRWLLAKDLRILRRSPLLVALLILYPILIALLIGFALSRGPDKPRVAFLNLVPSNEVRVNVGDQQIDASKYAGELFKSIEPVRVKTRKEALQKVKDGDALAAVIIPADAARKLQAELQGTGQRPRIEVYYNAEDPVKAAFVQSTIESRLADANLALSTKFTEVAAGYIGLLLKGGSLSVLGQEVDILGLERARTILLAVQASLPASDPQRKALQPVIDFATLAIENLGFSGRVLTAISEPIDVKTQIVSGSKTPLESFAVAVAVTISLMFVTVLLAAGLLALEREEHAFTRLVRGLVSRSALLSEKIILAALCAFAVAMVMLLGISPFVSLDFGRFPLWVAALAAGALAFAALGVAIGGLAREVRAASLLAIMLSLPIAFLALVPSGAVSSGLYDVIRVISACFPFKPALQAMNAALNDSDPGILGPLIHLVVLTFAFGAIGRLALRRFA
jgi:ABC-type multidrug transport system permease subunit